MDRSAAKAALMKKFTDPNRPPMPGMVALRCSECSAHIVWVNPPLPPNGKTVCRECGGRL
jgi:DNA-directed RNA polymerase subunit RPC12/RpoP